MFQFAGVAFRCPRLVDEPIDTGVPHDRCPAVSNSVNPKAKSKSTVPSTSRGTEKN